MWNEPTGSLLWQHKGDVPRGEEPAEFPGAALWEVGGELLRRWRASLLYHLCHAHHAAWALEDFAPVLSAEALSHCTRPQGLSGFHHQVRTRSFTLPSFFFTKKLWSCPKNTPISLLWNYKLPGSFWFILRASLVASLRLTDKTPKEYAVYRSPLLFWGLVDLVYDMFRVSVSLSPAPHSVHIKSKYLYFFFFYYYWCVCNDWLRWIWT